MQKVKLILNILYSLKHINGDFNICTTQVLELFHFHISIL